MGDRQLIAAQPIAPHQDPSRQPLLDLSRGIGEGRLRGLNAECLDIPQQQGARALTLLRGGRQVGGGDAVGPSRRLHDAIAGGPVDTQHDAQPDHDLMGRHPDLDLMIVRGRNDRDHP